MTCGVMFSPGGYAIEVVAEWVYNEAIYSDAKFLIIADVVVHKVSVKKNLAPKPYIFQQLSNQPHNKTAEIFKNYCNRSKLAVLLLSKGFNSSGRDNEHHNNLKTNNSNKDKFKKVYSMKKIVALAAFTVISAAFTGCEESDPTAPGAGNNTYFPLSNGSSWTYEAESFFGTVEETVTIQGDTTINGRKYIRAVHSGEEGEIEYMRRSNDTVFAYEDGIERIRVIERQGASWSESFEEEEVSGTMTYTVKSKGGNRTVLNRQYSNILHVEATGSMEINGEVEEIEFNGYLAKGIGLIEESSPLAVSKLKSYTIK